MNKVPEEDRTATGDASTKQRNTAPQLPSSSPLGTERQGSGYGRDTGAVEVREVSAHLIEPAGPYQPTLLV